MHFQVAMKRSSEFSQFFSLDLHQCKINLKLFLKVNIKTFENLEN